MRIESVCRLEEAAARRLADWSADLRACWAGLQLASSEHAVKASAIVNIRFFAVTDEGVSQVLTGGTSPRIQAKIALPGHPSVNCLRLPDVSGR